MQGAAGEGAQWTLPTSTVSELLMTERSGYGDVLPEEKREGNIATRTLFSSSPPGVKDPPPHEDLFGRSARINTDIMNNGGAQSENDADSLSNQGGNDTGGVTEFSGFEVAMAKLGEKILNPAVVERELTWQDEATMSESTAAQQEFRDQVLQEQTMRAFALMQDDSPYLTICHSVGKFFNSPGEHAKALHGKYIGVIGDRTQYRDPSPVILPAVVWEWKTPVVHTAVGAIKEFYEHEENYDRLYVANDGTAEKTAAGKKGTIKKSSIVYVGDEKEVCVPYMLSLPSYLLSRLSTRAYWTPWDLMKLVEEGIQEYDGQIEASKWNLIRDWCLAACQQAGNKTESHLGVRVSPVSQLDPSFQRWIDYRLNMVFGPRHVNTTGFPAGGPPPRDTRTTTATTAPAGPTNPGRVLAGTDLAAEVGRGIALGLQAATNAGFPLQGLGARNSMATTGEQAKHYSTDSIAAIKGFSCTANIGEVPTIWATFQTTKNVDVHRRYLHFGMEQWARAQGVEIDRGVFFEQKSVEDIVNLRFNPGQGVAQFKSAERGLSLLICRTRTPEEIERVRDREAAEQLTQATRVLEEALKLSRSDPRAPAGNYFELKLNITTFCALLYVLFGAKCEYYKSLLLIRNCMDTPGVYNIRQAYTADICHRISWAIIDEGRSFFSTVMIQQDFAKPTIVFPVTLLDSILPEVRYANQIMRASFPKEWNSIAPRQTLTAGTAAPIQWSAPGGLPPIQGGGQDQGRAAAPSANRQTEAWDDVRHPKIVAMMAPYITKFGNNVFVGELMSAAGVEVQDLPLPTGTKYISKDGKKAYLCWNAVLGKCKFGSQCKYKKNHPKRNELPDDFATAVVSTLQQAVTYLVATKESPTKKLKVEKVA